MRLKVILPDQILVDEEVKGVVAEAEDGSLGLLPKHIDFVTALVPGIIAFQSAEGEEFLAVDGGILVKCAADVLISTRKAVRSRDLGGLSRTVQEEFEALDEGERKTRSILAKLEADFTRHFLEMRLSG
ncbi:MAG: F0F1 ATP synthase subunit epsilon [Methanothrix sp.]|uniref:F0F1 ATP synthase subunit epsilon n=1 Tax=Methanothrix sp. TaxID=90426 RepID=UPI0025E27B70|nr:F0F1 ATP synthase subunit epsilon [Methanothrix sp.]MBK7387095.1 F0F1 ATP synthase subunit epsilon [Methanothrix sp.]